MKTSCFEVISQEEVERIHTASMEILAEVGIKVNYKKIRNLEDFHFYETEEKQEFNQL